MSDRVHEWMVLDAMEHSTEEVPVDCRARLSENSIVGNLLREDT